MNLQPCVLYVIRDIMIHVGIKMSGDECMFLDVI